jgi:hypothetical protein
MVLVGVKVVRPRFRCGRSPLDSVRGPSRECSYEGEEQRSKHGFLGFLPGDPLQISGCRSRLGSGRDSRGARSRAQRTEISDERLWSSSGRSSRRAPSRARAIARSPPISGARRRWKWAASGSCASCGKTACSPRSATPSVVRPVPTTARSSPRRRSSVGNGRDHGVDQEGRLGVGVLLYRPLNL